MKNLNFWSFLPFIGIVILTACDSKGDPEPDENELITTVQLTVTDPGNVSKTVSWKDSTGSGKAVIDTLILSKNVSYTYSVKFLDQSQSPEEDITTEIKERSDEHLLVFTPSPTALLAVTITDKDKNGLPIGLVGSMQTQTTAGTGKLKIQLRHQPGVKDGSAVPGSDDANVDFPVVIQ
ncbi:MAG: hypothetical protein QM669_10450 [Siphonobacter sp.]